MTQKEKAHYTNDINKKILSSFLKPMKNAVNLTKKAEGLFTAAKTTIANLSSKSSKDSDALKAFKYFLSSTDIQNSLARKLSKAATEKLQLRANKESSINDLFSKSIIASVLTETAIKSPIHTNNLRKFFQDEEEYNSIEFKIQLLNSSELWTFISNFGDNLEHVVIVMQYLDIDLFKDGNPLDIDGINNIKGILSNEDLKNELKNILIQSVDPSADYVSIASDLLNLISKTEEVNSFISNKSESVQSYIKSYLVNQMNYGEDTIINQIQGTNAKLNKKKFYESKSHSFSLPKNSLHENIVRYNLTEEDIESILTIIPSLMNSSDKLIDLLEDLKVGDYLALAKKIIKLAPSNNSVKEYLSNNKEIFQKILQKGNIIKSYLTEQMNQSQEDLITRIKAKKSELESNNKSHLKSAKSISSSDLIIESSIERNIRENDLTPENLTKLLSLIPNPTDLYSFLDSQEILECIIDLYSEEKYYDILPKIFELIDRSPQMKDHFLNNQDALKLLVVKVLEKKVNDSKKDINTENQDWQTLSDKDKKEYLDSRDNWKGYSNFAKESMIAKNSLQDFESQLNMYGIDKKDFGILSELLVASIKNSNAFSNIMKSFAEGNYSDLISEIFALLIQTNEEGQISEDNITHPAQELKSYLINHQEFLTRIIKANVFYNSEHKGLILDDLVEDCLKNTKDLQDMKNLVENSDNCEVINKFVYLLKNKDNNIKQFVQKNKEFLAKNILLYSGNKFLNKSNIEKYHLDTKLSDILEYLIEDTNLDIIENISSNVSKGANAKAGIAKFFMKAIIQDASPVIAKNIAKTSINVSKAVVEHIAVPVIKTAAKDIALPLAKTILSDIVVPVTKYTLSKIPEVVLLDVVAPAVKFTTNASNSTKNSLLNQFGHPQECYEQFFDASDSLDVTGDVFFDAKEEFTPELT